MMDLEEPLEDPIDVPLEIWRYSNKDIDLIFEFEKRPNLGKDKHFDSELITNYVVMTVRTKSTDEVTYGKIIMPKQMGRIIKTKNLVPIE